MAAIAPTPIASVYNRPSYTWDEVTESDTMDSVRIEGGKYTCTVEGTFGGTSIEFQYSKTGDDFHTIDSDNLTFTAAGSYNIEAARGYVKPVRTGGSSTDVNVFLTAIPEDRA